jgi:hypothetical protein
MGKPASAPATPTLQPSASLAARPPQAPRKPRATRRTLHPRHNPRRRCLFLPHPQDTRAALHSGSRLLLSRLNTISNHRFTSVPTVAPLGAYTVKTVFPADADGTVVLSARHHDSRQDYMFYYYPQVHAWRIQFPGAASISQTRFTLFSQGIRSLHAI